MDCRVERRESAEGKCATSLLPGWPWCEPPVLGTPAAQVKVTCPGGLKDSDTMIFLSEVGSVRSLGHYNWSVLIPFYR